MLLEAELPTPATVDSDWWDHQVVSAFLAEAGLDHNQNASVSTIEVYYLYLDLMCLYVVVLYVLYVIYVVSCHSKQ